MTQGIMLQTGDLKVAFSKQKNAVSQKNDFGKMLDNKSTGNDTQAVDKATVKVKVSQQPNSMKKLSDNTDTVDQNDFGQQLNELEKNVVDTLSEQTGLTQNEVMSILQTLNLTPMDMLSTENVSKFVLELHGVDDSSLLLTSDTLNNEMNQIMDAMEDISDNYSDLLSNNEFISFAETKQEMPQQVEEFVAPIKNDEVQPKKPTIEIIKQDAENISQSNSISASEETKSQTSDEDSHSSLMNDEGNQTPLFDQFMTKLTQGVNEVHSETFTPGQTMEKIVTQVVDQIKIRVMPETTSMELQLNPENLGKVGVVVSAKDGVATATLTCQNETAKAALESQMSVLKEAFNQQGLKVESVEVNVSDFSFTNENFEKENQQQQKKSSHHRFNFDSDTEENDTTEQVIMSDSRVNYTA